MTIALTSEGWNRDAGLVALLLHGYGADERDLAGIGDLLSGGLPWASLRAPLTIQPGAHAWFEITTPGNPAPRPLALATEAIWEWVDTEVSATTGILPIGFSQGGLMATQLLRTRPDRIPAAVVLAGFVQAAEQPGDAAIAATRPPVFWGRGSADQVIAPAAVARTSSWLPGHCDLTERVYPGLGHGINAQEAADVTDFLTRVTSGG